MSKTLFLNARLTTTQGASLEVIDKAAVVCENGRIAWFGLQSALPAALRADCDKVHDLQGALMTPGLIDCHTHLVYAGDRAREFELRLEGASYEEVSRQGGGIRSTVAATRAATQDQLTAQSEKRLQALMQGGVTMVEIKSGYGLELEAERKCLRAARTLAEKYPVSMSATFLGAHAVPPEFVGRADDYVNEVLSMLPILHREGLVDAVDAFCERIGFTLAQTQRVFEAARSLNLPIKLHAEQLSDCGGAQLAARYGALSCDHLEYISDEGVQAMATAGTVAVLLPGAFYFLREKQLPPVEKFRAAKVPMAIATDCNPGSSPVTSMPLMMNMACTLFRMTPNEALLGVTLHAAKALGLSDRGVVALGKRADFAVWDAEAPNELCYSIGGAWLLHRVYEGELE